MTENVSRENRVSELFCGDRERSRQPANRARFSEHGEDSLRPLYALPRHPPIPACARLYVMLNAGGTVHTQEEIDRVRALIAAKEATGA